MGLLFSSRSRGAESANVSASQKWLASWIQYSRQMIASLGELWRTPFASLMTISVLGISLTLPMTLHILVKNVQTVSSSFESASEISLFLKKNVSVRDSQQLAKRLSLYPEIESVVLIDKEEALQEFKQTSGFGNALDFLEENPLPTVISVTPVAKYRTSEPAKSLLNDLEQEREVEFGKLDIEWLERLNAIIQLLNESVFVMGLLLLSAVILIIGNTIRLSIMNKRDEIEIMKLVGATNGFIQRPFLFTGVWFGFFGGVIAFIVVTLMLWWLESSIGRVAGLYGTGFSIEGISLTEFFWLIFVAVGLGLAGSFMSVQRYIGQIEPDTV